MTLFAVTTPDGELLNCFLPNPYRFSCHYGLLPSYLHLALCNLLRSFLTRTVPLPPGRSVSPRACPLDVREPQPIRRRNGDVQLPSGPEQLAVDEDSRLQSAAGRTGGQSLRGLQTLPPGTGIR